jgi:hypothetical protein
MRGVDPQRVRAGSRANEASIRSSDHQRRDPHQGRANTQFLY